MFILLLFLAPILIYFFKKSKYFFRIYWMWANGKVVNLKRNNDIYRIHWYHVLKVIKKK